MADNLQVYQEILKEKLAEISKNFTEISTNNSNHKYRKELLNTIDKDLIECEKMLKTMQIQIVTEYSLQEEFKLYLKNYKSNIEKYRTKYNQLILKVYDEENQKTIDTEFNDKSTLTSDEGIEYYKTKSNLKLQEAERACIAIEINSNNILHDLGEQTDQMKNINKNINKMNGSLDSSNDVMNSMKSLNERNNKIIMWFAFAFIAIFVVFLTFKIVMAFQK